MIIEVTNLKWIRLGGAMAVEMKLGHVTPLQCHYFISYSLLHLTSGILLSQEVDFLAMAWNMKL